MKQFSLIGCILILLLQYTDFAYGANLTVFCGETSNNESYSLDNPLPLLKSKCFNESRITLIYAFGFTTDGADVCTQKMLKSYLTCENYNVILFDWSKEVASPFEGVGRVLVYPEAYINTIKIGQDCGKALNMLSNSTLNPNASMDLNNTHLVGHSLGAQMFGVCGNELHNFNKNVSRVTGLDPANPGFKQLDLFFLNAKSGKFVDVLHTEFNLYGINTPVGQVDTWFNCNNNQPQCANETFLQLVSCNHQAACFYFATAIEESQCVRNTSFIAVSSESCAQWRSQNAAMKSNKTIYIGETTDRNARGNYYLRTEAQEPYGEGEDGI